MPDPVANNDRPSEDKETHVSIYVLTISITLRCEYLRRVLFKYFKAYEHEVRTVQDQAIIQTDMREVGGRLGGMILHLYSWASGEGE